MSNIADVLGSCQLPIERPIVPSIEVLMFITLDVEGSGHVRNMLLIE